MNKFAKLGTASAALVIGSTSFAQAIDVTAATAGVTSAQVAVLAVLGVMITMAAAIFGVNKVLQLLGR